MDRLNLNSGLIFRDGVFFFFLRRSVGKWEIVICFFYVFSSSGGLISGSRKRTYESTRLGAWYSNLSVAEGQKNSASAGATPGSCCRPWHRGDFVKRLATFKSISWFAKPKVVS